MSKEFEDNQGAWVYDASIGERRYCVVKQKVDTKLIGHHSPVDYYIVELSCHVGEWLEMYSNLQMYKEFK